MKTELRNRTMLARLQFVLAALAHSRQTARQLAGEYEVSTKTIVRDIEILRQMGVDIFPTSSGYHLQKTCQCQACGRFLL